MEWCSGHSGEYTGDLGTRAPEGGVFGLEAAQPCRRPFECTDDLGTRAPEGGVFWLEAAQPCRRPFECTGDLGTRAPEGGRQLSHAGVLSYVCGYSRGCRRTGSWANWVSFFMCVAAARCCRADGVLVACGSTFLVFIGVFGEDIAPRINPCMH
eukprot:1160612-Pelagomonas_calceolata.AAC.3